MHLDGLRAHHQLTGDLAVRHAIDDEARDGQLLRRQAT
jgi:hypothetical protein